MPKHRPNYYRATTRMAQGTGNSNCAVACVRNGLVLDAGIGDRLQYFQ